MVVKDKPYSVIILGFNFRFYYKLSFLQMPQKICSRPMKVLFFNNNAVKSVKFDQFSLRISSSGILQIIVFLFKSSNLLLLQLHQIYFSFTITKMYFFVNTIQLNCVEFEPLIDYLTNKNFDVNTLFCLFKYLV